MSKTAKKTIYFGNAYWNQATDNREKAVLQLSEERFLQLRQQLDTSGMNYFAYLLNGQVRLAFLENEKRKIELVLHERNLQTEKPVRSYEPAKKNIFGNTQFQYIREKSYLYGSKQEQLKLAEKLESAGIRFSGIVYSDKRTGIAVSYADLAATRALQQQAKSEVASLEARAKSYPSEMQTHVVISVNAEDRNRTERLNQQILQQKSEMMRQVQTQTPPLQMTDAAIQQETHQSRSIRRMMFDESDPEREIEEELRIDPDLDAQFVQEQKEPAPQEKSFAEQVEASLNGELPFYTALKVCDTPDILLQVGCEQLPMLYTQKHLKDALADKDSSNIHKHGLEKDQLKRLPELLTSPIMIYDSLSRNDSIIAVTSEIDKDKLPIVVSIKPNGRGRYDLETIDSNFITSVHGRDNFIAQFTRAVEQDNMLFCDKEKSQELFERWGLQLPELTNTLDFNHIIHQSRNIVKGLSEKNLENAENTQARKFYRIYQMNEDEASQENKDRDPSINVEDYHLVYEGDLNALSGETFNEKFDALYDTFGIAVSLHDVIVRVDEDTGEEKAFYCDENGFTDFPEFFEEKTVQDEKENIPVTSIEPDAVAEHSIDAETFQKLLDRYHAYYDFFYQNPDYAQLDDYVTAQKLCDDFMLASEENSLYRSIVQKYVDRYQDFLTSDREFVAFAFALAEVGVIDSFSDLDLENLENMDPKRDLTRFLVNTYLESNSWTSETQRKVADLWETLNQDEVMGWKVASEAHQIAEFFRSLYAIGDDEYASRTYSDAVLGLLNGYQFETQDYEKIHIRQTHDLHSVSISSEGLVNFERFLFETGDEWTGWKGRFEFAIDAGLFPKENEPSEPINTQEKAHPTRPESTFKIEDESLGEGGLKTKFKANIAAIETLKAIEAEHRPATLEEKQIMSQYVGWGGLANAFDESKSEWASEFAQLKSLLTKEEYDSARASTLDAFYTTPTVIDGIYSALENFGFSGGNVLEPSCGVGNFIGRMPEKMRENSNVYGVELDSLTGRLAKAIYPEADIQVKGFEKTEFQNGCFDVAVGNVPFGDLGFTDKQYGTHKLHDFFFAQTLDKVKEGGIVAFVTSMGTLDKQDDSFRKQLAEKADLIGAIRLPNTAFKANANTEVTSDLIFLKKRSEPPKELPDWVNLGKTEEGFSVNQYFVNHPEMVLIGYLVFFLPVLIVSSSEKYGDNIKNSFDNQRDSRKCPKNSSSCKRIFDNNYRGNQR